MDQEGARARQALEPISHKHLGEACLEALVREQMDTLHNECKVYLERQQLAELHKMYRLLKLPEKLDRMITFFEEIIATEGLEKMEALEAADDLNPQTFTDTLIALHHHFTDILSEAFENDHQFIEALDKAFRIVVNVKTLGGKGPAKAAEFLSKMCDAALKKTSKAATEAETEKQLCDLVAIFKYVDDKDVFQKFYAKMLARRLINNNSISEEAEVSMIGKLKDMCGYEYTSKLQRMFNDVRISADLKTRFQAQPTSKQLTVHFTSLVLQTGAWPLGSTGASSLNLPVELHPCVSLFEDFYTQTQHNGRRLTWLYHLTNGDVKARIGKRVFELQATTFQIAVLLQFNSVDELPFSNILDQTGMNDRELARTLGSLVTCHLIKSTAANAASTSSFEPTDVFSMNQKFNSKKKRVRISAALQKETQAETQQTHKAIDEDRRLFLQAVAVRILKMRKQMQYNVLVEEIIEQSSKHFKPSVASIKKCIEELIETQYMERKEGDRKMLFYIA